MNITKKALIHTVDDKDNEHEFDIGERSSVTKNYRIHMLVKLMIIMTNMSFILMEG